MKHFQATKLEFKLMIFHSHTRCELWLQTKLSFLYSAKALRRWELFTRIVDIILRCWYGPKVLFNGRFCFEIEQFSEFSVQSYATFWS